MAEKKPLNRGAKILKDKLDKARIKNANSRARKNAKPGTGTISEKLKEASSRKPPKSNLPAIRKENLPAKSPGRNVVKFKAPGREVVPYKPPGREVVPYKGAAGNAAKSFVGRRALAALGPAGMLASMTTSTGDGQEDKPRGPLMRGRPVASYSDQQVNRAGKGDLPKKKEAAPPPKPKAKPTREVSPEKKKLAADFRAKMQGQKKTFAKPKEKTYPFKGNWVGAAPTEMQKRGGQRRKQGNLMSFLKKMRDD